MLKDRDAIEAARIAAAHELAALILGQLDSLCVTPDRVRRAAMQSGLRWQAQRNRITVQAHQVRIETAYAGFAPNWNETHDALTAWARAAMGAMPRWQTEGDDDE